MTFLPIILLLPATHAALPMPTFPDCGEPDDHEACPDDLGRSWEHLSYIPAEWKANIPEVEQPLGTGIWADQAWRTQTGRTEVVIAIMDSGILWDEEDVLRKHYLNAAELPLPLLEDGSEAADHDANGDGLFNIDDYADDPRVDWASGLDPNMDEILDPSDLIHSFSDGIDDDDNGFVDDISGWDFFWNDNDPYDDTRFDHGAFEARLSVAEGDDGKGWIGACPNCMVMNLRMGDSFVVDAQNFATGLVYAVDNGAAVVQEALGAMNDSPYVREAIEYAWDADVLVVASAADEVSYHHNYPGVNAHTLYVHAIVPNDDEDEATSFLAYSNCTNHGSRLDLSVSSPYCSSGATGLAAGVAGLMVSEAWEQGILLSAAEQRHLMVSTADDIDLQPDVDAARAEGRYPSGPGWDRYSGHGRLNAAHAVEAVANGQIPPEVDISSPRWFEPVVGGGAIEITGRVAADRSSAVHWALEVGAGDAPSEWLSLASGEDAIDGVLGQLDPSAVPGFDPSATLTDYAVGEDQIDREDAVNVHTLTLRLTAEDAEGLSSIQQRAFFSFEDPDLLPGFPIEIGASLESSPTLVDLDEDGVLDILIGDGDGWVHALHADGAELPGWPVTVSLLEELDPAAAANHLSSAAFSSGAVASDHHASVVGTVAAGDLDGDGHLEVVAADLRGALYVWDAAGQLLPGFPVGQEAVSETDPDHWYDEGFFGAPALGDLDGDGDLEIVVGGMDQLVYAWQADGSPVSGWPVHPEYGGYDYGSRIIASPAIGDLDGDGRDDVVVGTSEKLNGTYGPVYALSGLGNEAPGGAVLPGWPVALFGAYTQALPYVGEGVPSTPALGDLDGDGSLEIAAHTIAGQVEIFHSDGSSYLTPNYTADGYGAGTNANDASAFPFINSTALGDLDGDGHPDLITGALGAGYAVSQLYDGRYGPLDFLVNGWSGADGSFLPGWPRVIEDLQFFVNPAIADLDGDGKVEAISGSGGWVVHAWNVDGVEPEGWPRFTGHWMIGSPAVGDIDGDGLLDVVQGTRHGWLYAWRSSSTTDAPVAWQSFGHDPANTNNHDKPLEGYNPVATTSAIQPGGCCHKGKGAGMLLLFPLLGLGGLRRRRR